MELRKETSVHKQTLTTTKNKKRNYTFLKIVLAACIGMFFYVSELIPKYSESYENVYETFLETKAKNKEELARFKKAYAHTSEYKIYEQANTAYKAAIKKHKKAVVQEKFLGFDTFYGFSIKFFPLFGLFFYCLYNLYTSLQNNKKDLGSKIIHGTILIYVFFKLYWIFRVVLDYSKFVYICLAVISAYLVGLATFIIYKKREALFIKLQNTVNVLSRFSLITAKKYIAKDKVTPYEDKLLEVLEENIE